MKTKEIQQIAIIGIGCIYPGANNPLTLWENVLSRRQQFRRLPDCRLPSGQYFDPDPSVADKTYQNKASVITDFAFDWMARRIPKRSFESTDIVHWLTLDVALQAISDAGYSKERIPKEKTGVIIGNTLTGEFTRSNQMPLRWPYVKKVLLNSLEHKGLSHHFNDLEQIMEEYYKSVFYPMTEDSLAGGLANTIAGRVCNFLDIHGGGYIVDGACSSSLLAICTAANHLSLGQMDMVIAGGVDISLDTFELVGFSKTGALTETEMRVYDKAAKGFLPGEGCGIVILKRLDDALRDNDQVYSILNGWGISSDGKGGITAPSANGQAYALKRAHQAANLNTADLSFVEGHGTGTTVGDKTELEGISIALNDPQILKPRSCGVTSFKSIVGHTKAAAGVGAFIKTVIALNQRVLPPTAGLKEANPIFTNVAKSLYPILQGEVKDSQLTLFAGVSAMGFGGINSHVVLQSGQAPFAKFKPALPEKVLFVHNQQSELFLLAGRDKDQLLAQLSALIEKAQGISYAEMADLAMQTNLAIETEKDIRASVIACYPDELLLKLEKLKFEIENLISIESHTFEKETIFIARKKENVRVGAVFPGQGSQKINMARRLIERFDWASQLLDQAEVAFGEFGQGSLKDLIYQTPEKAIDASEENSWKDNLKQTQIAQPAIVLASILWFTYLQKLGVRFKVVAGHSLGELSAFYAANLFGPQTLYRFAAYRGMVMSKTGSGSMASLMCSKKVAQAYIDRTPGYVTIANKNSHEQTVISGETASVKHLIKLAELDSITAVELSVSAAFHSDLIQEAAHELGKFASATSHRESQLSFTEELETVGQGKPLLISSVSGKPLPEKVGLANYFAAQAINPVDFVATIEEMQNHCDVLLEIGPGRVLSNLANSIQNTIKSFPVEAIAEDDLSLNTALGALFVQGVDLNPAELYASRLIRPFVATTQKSFLINPLERPFPEELLLQKAESIESLENRVLPSESSTALDGVHAGNFFGLSLPMVDLTKYLELRSDFLKDVIMTDLKHLQPESMNGNSTNNYQISKLVNLQVEAPSLSQSPKSFSVSSSGVTQSLSLKMGREALTPSSTYSTSSPKPASSTQALAEDKQAHNLNYLTNHKVASPKENFQNYSAVAPLKLKVPKEEIQSCVLETIADKTGFPQEQLTPDLRLLDDLNMDSIKASTLLGALLKKYSLQGQVDVSGKSNSTIAEIVDMLFELLNPAADNVASDQTFDSSMSESLVKSLNSYQNAQTIASITSVSPVKDSRIHKTENHASLTRKSVSSVLLQLTSDKTGFPAEQLELELRLLDDLNMDSIKAGSLLGALLKNFDLQGQLNASDFANATLQEIIDAVCAALEAGLPEDSIQDADDSVIEEDETSPVKSYFPCLQPMPLEEVVNAYQAKSKLKQLLIVRQKSQSQAIEQMAAAFEKYSDSIISLSFEELKTASQNQLERIVVFMPEAQNTQVELLAMVEALANLAKLYAQNQCGLAFIQVGNSSLVEQDISRNSLVGVQSWAASLHLENPEVKIRVLEFDPDIHLETLAGLIDLEFLTEKTYENVVYNQQNQRFVVAHQEAGAKNLDSGLSAVKQFDFNSQDVVLVTGGGKGITAECALALAQEYKCKMVLLGSSLPNQEVESTLKRFSDLSLKASYYQCDITRFGALQETIRKVTQELGSITSVLHGAGLNRARRCEQVSSSQAIDEISPKLFGAWNLIEALKDQPLKSFLALSSIIGVTGMAGNAWYAFSNECLSLLLQNFSRQFRIPTLCFAYSIWSEVGMGHKMGSNEVLAKIGIASIPPSKGVREFMRWVKHNAQYPQVVIAAGIAGLDTWRFDASAPDRVNPSLALEKKVVSPELMLQGRYLEEITYFEAGKSLISKVHLTVEDDLYLKDHNFNGSLLFPTVFGLEAMAQVAAAVLEQTNIQSVRFNNITLHKPIVVSDKDGLFIQISALVEEVQGLEDPKVFVNISTEDSNFKQVHFSCEVVFNQERVEQANQSLTKELPAEPLALEAETDLYTWLLFQGPMFQNIDKIYVLNSKRTVFSVKEQSAQKCLELCFSDKKRKPFILGNPLLRDLLLQSGQLILTKEVWLPLEIERWTINLLDESTVNSDLVECLLLERKDKNAIMESRLVGSENVLQEEVLGYRIQELRAMLNFPESENILLLNNAEAALKDLCSNSKESKQVILYKNRQSFNQLSKPSRHELQQEQFQKLISHSPNLGLNQFTHKLEWKPDGKPYITGSDLEISISHSQSFLLMVVGESRQACDIEYMEAKNKEEWQSLLGLEYSLLEGKEREDSFDLMAYALWSVKEICIKAALTLKKGSQDFDLKDLNNLEIKFYDQIGQQYLVKSLVLEPLPGQRYLVSFLEVKTGDLGLSEVGTPVETLLPRALNKAILNYDPHYGGYVYDFYTTFKDCKSTRGTTHFTNFPLWMGSARELMLISIKEFLVPDLLSGKYGMVTNFSEVVIYGEAETLENIFAVFSLSQDSDFDKSIIGLHCKWFILKSDSELIQLAECKLVTTWVEILGAGIVKTSPLPEYLLNFLLEKQGEQNNHFSVESSNGCFSEIRKKYSEILLNSKQNNLAIKKLRPPIVNIFSTSQVHSNSVGNIYFSNFYDWQSLAIESFFKSDEFKSSAFCELKKSHNKTLVTLNTSIHHLQELMPFETVKTKLYYEFMGETAIRFYFDFYKLNANNNNDESYKLAYGENFVVLAP